MTSLLKCVRILFIFRIILMDNHEHHHEHGSKRQTAFVLILFIVLIIIGLYLGLTWKS